MIWMLQVAKAALNSCIQAWTSKLTVCIMIEYEKVLSILVNPNWAVYTFLYRPRSCSGSISFNWYSNDDREKVAGSLGN